MKLIRPKELELAAPYVSRGPLVAEKFRTFDTAIAFRMGSGAPGDINRGHPASIEPCLISPINPITLYGQPCLVDTAGGSNSGVRPLTAGDTAITDIWGITARPYPIQQAQTSNNYGSVGYGNLAPPLLQPIDVMRGGYMMVAVVGTPVKGGAVFIWCAASGGGHVQGGFEVVASGGNTCSLSGAYSWNNGPDANGIAEIIASRF